MVLQELPRGSTQATEYTAQLLAILDAAVQAASAGTHVLAILEVRNLSHCVPPWLKEPKMLACKWGTQQFAVTSYG